MKLNHNHTIKVTTKNREINKGKSRTNITSWNPRYSQGVAKMSIPHDIGEQETSKSGMEF